MSEHPLFTVEWLWKCSKCGWEGDTPERGDEFYNGPGFVESWLGEKPICPKCSADVHYEMDPKSVLSTLRTLEYILAPLNDCDDEFLDKLLYDPEIVGGLTPTLINLLLRYRKCRNNFGGKSE